MDHKDLQELITYQLKRSGHSFVSKIIAEEDKRQDKNIELIASENYPFPEVLLAMSSSLNNKYAEGYPSKESVEKFQQKFPEYIHTGNYGRYYGGCENVDQIELYARYQFQKAFNVVGKYHVNVQPHSGSQANFAAYQAVLKPGDKILSLDLKSAGHLTHGSPVNFSGQKYEVKNYPLDKDGHIDYGMLEQLINTVHPTLVMAGASAYSREIDYERIAGICDRASERLKYHIITMADIAHPAGLIAAGQLQSPMCTEAYFDIVTTTTHKTIRGDRGGVIFCKPEYAKAVDSAVFPYAQGGPLEHVIAGKAIAAELLQTDEYTDYAIQVIKNAKAMAAAFKDLGYKIVSGGTDNHMFLVDLTPLGITGKQAQDWLDKEHITLNKNCIPGEKLSPVQTSGIRIGTPAMTTRGWVEEDFVNCAVKIDKILRRRSMYSHL